MLQIDAHQHFWHPARGDYDWMPLDDTTLSRPYGPVDLAAERERLGIGHTVLVQAAATVQETEYMLGIADATPHVAAVVGWIDFEKHTDLDQLKRFANHPKFVGVRPMIQDNPDDDWMLRDDVQWGYRAVLDLGLTFDALGFPRHLTNFLTLLRRYPEMRAVVDHSMKPQIRNHSAASFRFWADGMRRIAKQTGAFCKLSGLVTEANLEWTVEQLRPYADHILTTFGPNRVMWGSDWPVCRLQCEYGDWLAAAKTLTESLDPAGRARVFGGTASDFYGLGI